MAELVESCFRLDTNLLRSDLQKARWHEPVDGFLNFKTDGRESALDYEIEYVDDKAYLVIMYGPEAQRVILSERELSYGTRTYLTCACGHRTNALYLKNNVFACLKCQKLRYESTTINRYSKLGKILYQNIRVLKLIKMKEDMTRPRWGRRYTKRFLRWFGLCSKAGLFDEWIREMKRSEKKLLTAKTKAVVFSKNAAYTRRPAKLSLN